MTEKTVKNIIARRNFRTPSEKLAFALGCNDAMDNMKGENLVLTRVNNKGKRSNKLLRLYFGAWIRCIVEDCEGYCTKEKIAEYRRCAPRHRSPSYDLRRAPRI